jgi:hypothetical protein
MERGPYDWRDTRTAQVSGYRAAMPGDPHINYARSRVFLTAPTDHKTKSACPRHH